MAVCSAWRSQLAPGGWELWVGGRCGGGCGRGVVPGDQSLLQIPSSGASLPSRLYWGSFLTAIRGRLVPGLLLKGPLGRAGLGLGAERSSRCLVSALLPPPWQSEWLDSEPRPPAPGFLEERRLRESAVPGSLAGQDHLLVSEPARQGLPTQLGGGSQT